MTPGSARQCAAALTALALVMTAHLRISAVFAGVPLSFPVGPLILAAGTVASAVLLWLAIRSAAGFRSAPWPRPAGAMAVGGSRRAPRLKSPAWCPTPTGVPAHVSISAHRGACPPSPAPR
jgi:hypothetical protein